MNKRQLQQMVENKIRRGPTSLFTDETLARFLSQAARGLRQREDAQEAWERVAKSDWLEQTRVLAFRDGTIEIGVTDGTLRYHLARQMSTLVKAMSRQVRGVQKLRFTPRSS